MPSKKKAITQKNFMKTLQLKKIFSISVNIFLILFIVLTNKIQICNAKKITTKSEKINLEFNVNIKNYNQKILILNDLNQKIAEFYIAIADTPDKQINGLMNLDYLPMEYGMLFVKNYPQKIQMWMKNTKIPLDMIFLDQDYKINYIHKNASPFSLETISHKADSIAVLELNGGIADKFQIQKNHKIIFVK